MPHLYDERVQGNILSVDRQCACMFTMYRAVRDKLGDLHPGGESVNLAVWHSYQCDEYTIPDRADLADLAVARKRLSWTAVGGPMWTFQQ